LESSHNDSASNYPFVLRPGNTQQIEEEAFIGRETELEQLSTCLAPQSKSRNVLCICGPGGVGKTQLCVQFATRFRENYSSIFWLNAKDEITLRQTFIALSSQVHNRGQLVGIQGLVDEEQAVIRMRHWLSKADNGQWLLILDEYDQPDFSEKTSSRGYDIRKYFPYTPQGSILITTRSPNMTFADILELGVLDVQQSLAVLEAKSGSDVNNGKGFLEVYIVLCD
jgi:AAA ATPase domain